jgi:hypothetical protein
MAITISGTSGVTYPAGGTDNVAGSGVGTTDTQTLTNKTLTSPTMSGAVVSAMASSVITSGTSQASTSGTSIDFTSIPSWVKRITVMYNNVSTTGAGILIQLGSGSVTTSGYSGGATFQNSTGVSFTSSTSGFYLAADTAAATLYGSIMFTNITGNTWVGNGTFYVGGSKSTTSAGGIALSGVLDRIRNTSNNGTDTFDAGSINILYE